MTLDEHFETAALAALTHLRVSLNALRVLKKYCGSFAGAWTLKNFSDLDIHSEDRSRLGQRSDQLIESIGQRCRKEGIASVVLGEKSYPLLLQEISAPPLYLFVRGDLELLSSVKPVAVVGTRKMTEYGDKILQNIIPPLVRAGATIISGLAYGVDSLAHEIALDNGGQCIAVLGSGVDVIYPHQHRSLVNRVLLSGGAIVSEQPLGMQPLKQHFPARNRIISGLSQSVLVIEAKEKSGSLITARAALEQNRDVYSVPGNIFQDAQKGTNLLIADGATPILSVDQLLAELHLSEDRKKGARRVVRFESPEEQHIYGLLQEILSVDELFEMSAMPISLLGQTLSLMELKGIVRNYGGMRYGRA